MIEVRELNKRLGNFRLQDVNMTLPEGYIMGMVGANGAGKTSLIRCLLGLYRPDRGAVSVDGRDYDGQERSIREELGFVLQEELFEPGMTCGENVDYYGGYYRRYDPELCRRYLREFGLEETGRCRRLSQGELLKLQFAFALAHEPKYLIMDEPAANFDPEFAERFYHILTEFVSDGEHSVLLSTHQTEGLERCCDYLLFLENGSVIYEGTLEEMRRRYRLVGGEAYQLKRIPEDQLIYMEEGAYGARALVKPTRLHPLDGRLTEEIPTIADWMYFMTKRKEGRI